MAAPYVQAQDCLAEVATHDVDQVTNKAAEWNAGYARAHWRKRCALYDLDGEMHHVI